MTTLKRAVLGAALLALPTTLLGVTTTSAATAAHPAAVSQPGTASRAAKTSSAPCTVHDATAKPSSTKPPVPKSGRAYFGGFAFSSSQPSANNTADSFASYESKACRPIDIAHVYVNSSKNFPPDRYTTTAARQGKIILLSWTGGDEAQMAAGQDNAQIIKIARQVKAFPYPVMFEFRWEMDLPVNSKQVHNAADFIKSWDLSRKIFAQQHVKNASWVWCPSAIGFKMGTAQTYYPGNSEVDWVCADAYTDYRFAPESTYQSPSLILHHFIVWRHHHMSKPIIIGESGDPGNYSNAWRVKWLKQMRTYVKAHTGIRAYLYFDSNPQGQPPSHDSALGNNPAVISAFRAMATDKHFRSKTRADPKP